MMLACSLLGAITPEHEVIRLSDEDALKYYGTTDPFELHRMIHGSRSKLK